MSFWNVWTCTSPGVWYHQRGNVFSCFHLAACPGPPPWRHSQESSVFGPGFPDLTWFPRPFLSFFFSNVPKFAFINYLARLRNWRIFILLNFKDLNLVTYYPPKSSPFFKDNMRWVSRSKHFWKKCLFLFIHLCKDSISIGNRNTFLSLKLIFHFERFRILSLLSTVLF